MKTKLLAGFATGLFLFCMVGIANSTSINVATSGTASQSSTGTFGGVTGYASNAIDGNITSGWDFGSDINNSVSHTTKEDQPWWQVKLEKAYDIEQLVLWNRTDHNLQDRLNGFDISIIDSSNNNTMWSSLNNAYFATSLTFDISSAVAGDIVKIQLPGTNYLHLAEVQVFTAAHVPEPSTMILLGTGLAGLAFYRRKVKR